MWVTPRRERRAGIPLLLKVGRPDRHDVEEGVELFGRHPGLEDEQVDLPGREEPDQARGDGVRPVRPQAFAHELSAHGAEPDLLPFSQKTLQVREETLEGLLRRGMIGRVHRPDAEREGQVADERLDRFRHPVPPCGRRLSRPRTRNLRARGGEAGEKALAQLAEFQALCAGPLSEQVRRLAAPRAGADLRDGPSRRQAERLVLSAGPGGEPCFLLQDRTEHGKAPARADLAERGHRFLPDPLVEVPGQARDGEGGLFGLQLPQNVNPVPDNVPPGVIQTFHDERNDRWAEGDQNGDDVAADPAPGLPRRDWAKGSRPTVPGTARAAARRPFSGSPGSPRRSPSGWQWRLRRGNGR